ncbi:hypothetical protein [Curtobacterium luteum]|uniref:hypothetical protein n=1 Tax=Curtobacterium luteum TaxID=33881 RepID=UPI003805FC31
MSNFSGPSSSSPSDGLDEVFQYLAHLEGANALRRAIQDASVIAVDAVFADIEELERARPRSAAELDLDALGHLPGRFAAHFDVMFARRFVLVLAEVTRRLATVWSRPASVAEELAFSVVFSYTQAVIEANELTVAKHWRSELEELMFEDLDFEFLYDDDSFLQTAIARLDAVNLTFEDWFKPFRGRYAAPYVED